MEWKRLNFTLFIIVIILPAARSVTCRWAESIESEGACFQYNSTKLSYWDANKACQSKGGVLATVKTRTQLDESTKNIDYCASIWIGANDIQKDGTWVWVDDNTVATELDSLWQSEYTQPSNGVDQDCAAIEVIIISDKGVFNLNCSSANEFLCMEKELYTTSDTTTSTSTTNNPATTTTADTTTSTSETNVPATTTTAPSTIRANVTPLKCGAYFIDINIILLLNWFAFLYLII